jgi:hypothetical protein
MKVSIIILAHQQAEYLAGAIGSAAAQTHPAVEVVVACGDATSAAVAERLQRAFPAIAVLTGLDRGRSHAMNTAVARSTGDYVLRLDADDVLVPDCVEQLVEKLPADVVGCDFQEFGSSRRRWSRQWATLTLAMEQTANGLPCTSLVARSLFDRVGGYDLALLGHEDWAFWIKCLKAGAVVRRVAEPLFFYRRHAGQVMMDHDAVLTAMIRLLHPDLYGVSDQDRAIVRGAPDKVRGWIARRAAWFPDDPASQRFAGLLKKPKPPVSAQSAEKPKILVYTTLYGGYDTVKPHPEHPRVAEWRLYTDRARDQQAAPGWTVVTDDILHWDRDHWSQEAANHESPRMRAKYRKCFPPSRLTLYLDASITLLSPGLIDAALEALDSGADWAMYPHPERDDVLDEALVSKSMRKYRELPVVAQAEHYLANGLPRHSGLWAAGIIARCATKAVRGAGEDWWTECVRWTCQDQLSLPVVLRRHGVRVSALTAGGGLWNNPLFTIHTTPEKP